MKSNSLELTDLTIAREGQVLLHGLTYRLNAGELLLVQGRNGAGKSTLLKVIAGLLPATSGDIHLNGQPLTRDFLPRPLLIGHARGLTLSMNVGDNVRLWAKLNDTLELYDAALHYFDLTDLENIPVEQLSAGWQQRVALTRLITMPSPLWLLDEPMANLDNDGVALLHSLLQSRLEQGGMALMTSHAEIRGEKVKIINISDLQTKDEVMH